MQPETEPARTSAGLGPLDAIRIARLAGGALWSQAVLHGQLAQVEWEQEKERLLHMLVAILAAFAFLLCTLLSASGLVLAATWDTAYRIPAVLALLLLFGFATVAAWRRFQARAALSNEIFAATRAELAADAHLLRNHDRYAPQQ